MKAEWIRQTIKLLTDELNHNVLDPVKTNIILNDLTEILIVLEEAESK